MSEGRGARSLERLAGSVYGGMQRWIEERYLELRYGVPARASEKIDLEELGYAQSGRSGYGPSPWGVLRRTFSPAEIGGDDVFIDFGCGMGRVVLEAARYPFRRVIGIDVVPEFISIARQIIERNRPRLRCPNVELVVADATLYDVPDDVTIAYFANPFSADIARRILRNLVRSAERRPRDIRVVYLAPPPLPTFEDVEGMSFVRYGRRAIRRWARADYLALHRICPRDRSDRVTTARS